jgi:hypothetical protein
MASCSGCGQALQEVAKFCWSCGKPQPPVPSSPPLRNAGQVYNAQPGERPESKVVWLIVGAIIIFAVIVAVAMIGNSGSDSSPSVAQQSSAPSATPPQNNQPTQTNHPDLPLPKFQIYKFDTHGMRPTIMVVPVNTTDEQLKSLLELFREKVGSRKFNDIRLKNERAGILLVYRGKKCASEYYVNTAGPCGDGDHDDALYQWGIEGDPDKDSGSIRVNGDTNVVF